MRIKRNYNRRYFADGDLNRLQAKICLTLEQIIDNLSIESQEVIQRCKTVLKDTQNMVNEDKASQLSEWDLPDLEVLIDDLIHTCQKAEKDVQKSYKMIDSYLGV